MVKTVPWPGHEVSSLSLPLTRLAWDAAGKGHLNYTGGIKQVPLALSHF